MTVIKICGLRRLEDAVILNREKVDAAGFVFYPPSRRFVRPELAGKIKKLLYPSIRTVGVFVKEDPERVAALHEAGIIDMAQLHGDESPDDLAFLRSLTDMPLIKAIRVRSRESLQNIDQYDCDYFLLDAFTKDYGGKGKRFDLSLLEGITMPKPFFLAGGLTAGNVAALMTSVHPYGVDVSSAVETDGIKDAKKIHAFIKAVRRKDEEDE